MKSTTINNPDGRTRKNLNRHFSKEDLQAVNRHMKRCSESLIIREMQIKSTLRYYFILIRMAVIKKFKKSVVKDMEKIGDLMRC